jgi:hypothetical protein
LPFPLEILIGSVFLAGSLFVNVVVRTTRMTRSDINEKEIIIHYDPERPSTIADLLVFGDMAMYQDKKGKKARHE